MPGPVMQDPTPAWMKPQNASVFDPWYIKAARAAINWLPEVNPLHTLADPQAQALGLMAPMAAGAEGASMLGPTAAKVADVFGIKAFHGSPHSFAAEEGAPLGRFRADKIGTGEGAQAFGHGHYFAEKEGTAKSYRDALSMQMWDDKGTAGRLFDVLSEHGTINGKVPIGPNATLVGRDELVSDFVSGKRNIFDFPPAIRQKVEQIMPQGHMYEVGIKAKPEEFLDWDAPLAQQPEAVRKLAHETWHGSPSDKLTGEAIYRNAATFTDPAKNAEFLRQLGIPGVRYFDAGSRNAAEGTRNYVVFPGNEHLIDILKKYGIVGAVGLGALPGMSGAGGGSGQSQ
jgi:hypothetical protein